VLPGSASIAGAGAPARRQRAAEAEVCATAAAAAAGSTVGTPLSDQCCTFDGTSGLQCEMLELKRGCLVVDGWQHPPSLAEMRHCAASIVAAGT